MQTGTIFNIQPFSVYDGPGIRTTVFFKGCNLRCAWCHNPESWNMKPEIQLLEEKCVGCGECFRTCPNGAHIALDNLHKIDRGLCNGCGKCADSCYAGAIALIGKTVSVDEVMKYLLEDAAYFKNSGGGVTFSGGEAMMQIEFLKELLQRCREAGIHTAVDTAGNLPFEQFEKIMPYTNLFLYDIKAFNSDVHKKLTGVPNHHILRNLPLLIQNKAEVIVRVPCIPGGNLDEMEDIAEYLKSVPVQKVELLAYHRLGEGKRRSLGMDAESFDIPSAEEMQSILKIFTDKKVNAVYNP